MAYGSPTWEAGAIAVPQGHSMWIPDWLYERLPLLYAAAAIASFFLFGMQGPSAISVPLLGAAALLISMRRRHHRNAKPTARRRTRVR